MKLSLQIYTAHFSILADLCLNGISGYDMMDIMVQKTWKPVLWLNKQIDAEESGATNRNTY